MGYLIKAPLGLGLFFGGIVLFNGSAGSGGGGTSGQIAKLERLQKLRESGALTDSEFEQEKAKILSES
jgi:Short C-terminal domain